MFRATALALVVLIPTVPAAANEFLLLRRGSQSKLYRVDDNLQLHPVTVRTIDLGGVPPTDPIDPVDPGDLIGVAKVAYEEAIKIDRPTESAVLAATYSAISDQVRSGALPISEASQTATTAVDTVLDAMNAKARWRPWRQAIADEFRGKDWRTADQYADAYSSLSAGLRAAAGGEGDALDFGAVIKLIAAIISKDPAAIAAAVLELIQSLRG